MSPLLLEVLPIMVCMLFDDGARSATVSMSVPPKAFPNFFENCKESVCSEASSFLVHEKTRRQIIAVNKNDFMQAGLCNEDNKKGEVVKDVQS
jgi:hypothetical protein